MKAQLGTPGGVRLHTHKTGVDLQMLFGVSCHLCQGAPACCECLRTRLAVHFGDLWGLPMGPLWVPHTPKRLFAEVFEVLKGKGLFAGAFTIEVICKTRHEKLAHGKRNPGKAGLSCRREEFTETTETSPAGQLLYDKAQASRQAVKHVPQTGLPRG